MPTGDTSEWIQGKGHGDSNWTAQELLQIPSQNADLSAEAISGNVHCGPPAEKQPCVETQLIQFPLGLQKPPILGNDVPWPLVDDIEGVLERRPAGAD